MGVHVLGGGTFLMHDPPHPSHPVALAFVMGMHAVSYRACYSGGVDFYYANETDYWGERGGSLGHRGDINL